MHKSKIKKPFVCSDEDIKQIIHRLTASQDVKCFFLLCRKIRFDRHDYYLNNHIIHMCFVVHCLKNNLNNWTELLCVSYTRDDFEREFYINNEDMEYITKLVTTHFTKKL